LKQAEELMKFQLRHGNDLLAMDCIRDSDINLLEQGQLIRQDEMIVQIGNISHGPNENGTLPFSFSISQLRSKKSLRRVFLFEDVIVFSKIKRNIETKQDIYLYRNSLKLSDIGMTENIGSSELKFEIWFRRYNYGSNYILQAPNMEVKQAWISNIHMLLDRQMQKVKEKRLLELTSMGLGSKPCSDLPPSSNQIIDRSINIPIRNARIRNSIAVSHFDSQTSIKCLSNPHYNTFKMASKENEDVSKRPTSTVSITSTHTSGLSSFASSVSSQFNQQRDNNQNQQPRTHRSHTIAALSFHQDDQDNKSKTLQSLASNESGIVPDILKDCCTNEKILPIDHESNQNTNNSEYDKINV
jgi:pleckstrin homology domain-containing family G member 4